MPDIHTTIEMTTSVWLEAGAAEFVKGKVLDVGCGRKMFKQMLPHDEWVGLDIRPVGDVHADAHQMPFDDDSFDTVLCINMLHECPSPLMVMQECARVLKPGGFLIFSAPNTWVEEGLWALKRSAFDYLIGACGLKGVSLAAHGKLFTREWSDFREYTKYGMPDPDGWLSHMDQRYPLISCGVARKE